MNKKIYLFTIVLLAVLVSRCDDVYDHVAAPPQANEQEAEQSIDGFTFALGTPFSSPIVLTNEILDEGTLYDAIRATATPELAEGAIITFKLEVSDTDEFLNAVELPSTSENNTATITATDLDLAVKDLYGKAPEARDIYYGQPLYRGWYYLIDVPTPAVLGPST